MIDMHFKKFQEEPIAVMYKFFCMFALSGSHLITAANFCMNGKFAVIGTYDGRCIFYETEVCFIALDDDQYVLYTT